MSYGSYGLGSSYGSRTGSYGSSSSTYGSSSKPSYSAGLGSYSLSDSSYGSGRSSGSSYSTGLSSYSSPYKSSSSYESPRSSSYLGSTATDRTIGYLTSHGGVNSLKEKFDTQRTGSSSSSLRPTSSYTSSSLDRYTAGSRSTDYGSGSGTSGSRLGTAGSSNYSSSDFDLSRTGGSSTSSSWSRPSATSSSTTSSGLKVPSYPTRGASPAWSRSTSSDYSRPSSRDYSVGSSSTRDYSSGGSSLSSTNAAAAARLKGSYSTLTPFETRRTARASDYSLTPFSSRFTDTSSSLAASAAASGASTSSSSTATDKPTTIDKPELSRQSSKDAVTESSPTAATPSTSTRRPTTLNLGDSSDSAEEPTEDGKRDPNVQYLTSRASSPMEPDRDVFDSRESQLLKNKNRNRLLSRTKTKAYPVGDRKRKRQLKNIQIQVDTEEIDRLSGRVRVTRGKYTNRYGKDSTIQIPKPVSQLPAAKRDRASSISETTQAVAETPKPQPTAPQPAIPLPKQSGFVPRSRIVSHDDDRNSDDETSHVTTAAAASAMKTKSTTKSEQETDVAPAPAQSCFLQRKWNLEKEKQKEEDMKMKKKREEQQAKDNISLKDSIEKVKSWKEQLVSSTPAQVAASKGGASDELDINAILGNNNDEWRKKKPVGRPGQEAPDKSNDAGSQLPPPSSSATSGRKSASARKTFGGVPAFPDESEIIGNGQDSSKLTVPKSRVNRSPSPYDNIRNQRPPSPYDNCQTVYPSMESLSGFAGDVSGSSDDESHHGVVSSSMRSQHSKQTGRNIPLNKATTSSLPDLVTSSEGGRRSPMVGSGNKFIGGVQDIDSLLGFSGDETDDIDNDYGSVASAQSRSEVSGFNGRTAVNAMPLSPEDQDGPMSYTHLLNSVMYGSDSQDERIFIGEIEDIDAVFGNDLVPASLGSSSTSATATSPQTPVVQQPRGNVGAPLHVVISQQQSADMGSSDSLLDTPVPDTPDVPLSPVPAFFLCESNQKSDDTSTTPRLKLDAADDTANSVDLADLSTDVGYADSDDERKSLDLLDGKSNGSRTDCDGQSVVDSVPTATLIDLDFTQESDSMDDEDEAENEAAVTSIEARQAANGQVTIGDIVEVCKRGEQSCKPPWIEEEEDRRFVGYNHVTEALESMEINVRKLDHCALSLYKKTESRPSHQNDSASDCGDSSVYDRVKATARVHAFIDQLVNSKGYKLRRALFSMKNMFQSDINFVKVFVCCDGLACLLKIGTDSHHTYQSYILRGLGQLMLYVDGMNSVVAHMGTIQWLYSLTSSKFYPVAKAALRLLHLFVDYIDCCSFMLLQAVHDVSIAGDKKIWSNLMNILQEKDAGHSDLSLLAISLINKVLAAVPDQDTFYDMLDELEDQGMERIIQQISKSRGARPELVSQFTQYETMLRQEDSAEPIRPDLIENIRGRRVRSRFEGRKSRRCKDSPRVSRQKEQRKDTVSGDGKPQFRQSEKQKNQGKRDEPGDRSASAAINSPADQAKEAPARHLLRSNSCQPSTDVTNRTNQNDHRSNAKQSQQELARANIANSRNETASKLSKTQPEDTTCDNENRDQKPDLKNEFSGLISRAKEGLSGSNRPPVSKSSSSSAPEEVKKPLKSEAELEWEQIAQRMSRALKIRELDFTDMTEVDDINYVDAQPSGNAPHPSVGLPPIGPPAASKFGGAKSPQIGPPMPPPPPPMLGGILPPPPLPPGLGLPPPPPPPLLAPKSPSARRTLKLHWTEAKAEFYTPSGRTAETVWSKAAREIGTVKIDTKLFAELFETKASEIKVKQTESAKKELTVLDFKRSNAINIGLTVLPSAAAIKTAIYHMDSTIMNREGIEKILTTMMPTEEEKTKIREVQLENPDIPLGPAENFLLTIGSITELPARLRLWAFTLDYNGIETEIANALQNLKQGIEELRRSRTFKYILATLLAIGNALNNAPARGFTMDYLAHVPEVKDTVLKHSLLHHLCSSVIEQFPDSTDLLSDITSVSNCAKVDWDELAEKLAKLEETCKASWDHLRAIVKHDNNIVLKIRLSQKLSDFAERTVLLKIIYKRVINKFNRFLLFIGYGSTDITSTKIHQFCKATHVFALEYRTEREKALQRRQKTNQSERKASCGKIPDYESMTLPKTKSSAENTRNSRAPSYDSENSKLPASGKLNKCSSLSRLDIATSNSLRNLARQPSGHYASDSENINDSANDEDIIDAVIRTASAASDRRPPRDRRRPSPALGRESVEKKQWRPGTLNRDRYVY